MRFFIALEIPDEDRRELKLVQNHLLKLLPGIRLTENDNLHLTLAFVGEQNDSLKEELIRIITEAVSGVKPFSITPSYIDGFPNIHHPHTIWVGVKGDVDKLVLIRERLKDSLTDLQIMIDERRFTPHIAIAKAKDLAISHQIERQIQELTPDDFQPITIKSIKLFQSIPDEGFHKHNTLAEIQLG